MVVESGAIIGGRYRVGRRLGKGGMGIVVEATHLKLGTHVAIKVLRADRSDPESVERFLREARAAAQLRGEHICRVHDFGTLDDGSPFMVMELLHGSDLAGVVNRSGPLDPAIASKYILQTCAAIAEAHALGIVHRDLKPSNLYVVDRPDGSASIKVLDFGIAKSTAKRDFALTETTNVMGSPSYMSPEQLKSSKNVDPRSDIWSLGVVLYELVSGRQPFRGETITELALNISSDPLPPLPESLPPAFVEVVTRCLQKNPERRFQNVGALATALEPFAKLETSVAGAVARVLTGMPPALDAEGAVTAHALPSNVTTLHSASGMVAATQRRPSHRRLAIAGAALIAVAIGLTVMLRPSNDDPPPPVTDPVAAPSAAAAPEPAVQPPPPPIDAAPAAAVDDAAVVIEELPADAAPDPVKPTPSHPKRRPKVRPTDLSKSRY